jgi:hypothetical protein
MSKRRRPLLKLPDERAGSPTPSPNDHVRTLIELMRPGGVDLARRWLAALLLVPPGEREEVVKAVEARIVAEYDKACAAEGDGSREIVVRYPAVQREGYVEEVVKRYGVAENGNGAGEERADRSTKRKSG